MDCWKSALCKSLIPGTKHTPKRVFPVVEPGRGYVELIGPIGDVFEPSRLPTLYLNEVSQGELDISKITIKDGGKGYRWFEESAKDIKVISRTGTGGVIKGDIDVVSKQLSSSFGRAGQGYKANDILLPSPPMSFDKGEAIELNARLHDPYSEYERVAFYINGVEINAPPRIDQVGFLVRGFTPWLLGMVLFLLVLFMVTLETLARSVPILLEVIPVRKVITGARIIEVEKVLDSATLLLRA